jgi:hypothetical protein
VALPASWTEASLIASMEREVEAVLSPLGLDGNDLLATAVEEDTPSILGVTSVAGVTYGAVADVIKVRTIAQWMAWQRAYDSVLLNVDLVSYPGDSIKDSQAFDHLRERLARAELMARRYDEVQTWLAQAHGVAYVSSTTPTIDPYRYPTTSGSW